jgi:peptidoglycan/xylan/chitin deacetylase (PgdA/CDA1 family)
LYDASAQSRATLSHSVTLQINGFAVSGSIENDQAMITRGWVWMIVIFVFYASYSCTPSGAKVDPPLADPAGLPTSKASGDNMASKETSPANPAKGPKKEVPILCYHRIREWRNADSRSSKNYIIPPDVFRSHIKMLADSGYHAILPDQLLDHMVFGDSLPAKPVMLTFDDGSLGQYAIGAKVLEKYGFRGVFFIMTIAMNKTDYISSSQLREMAENGHVIGSHTWDHKNVLKYEPADWPVQLKGSVASLEKATGKPVRYFAYPYGSWNSNAITYLKQYGFRAAFTLGVKPSEKEPLHTISRINIPGYWSAEMVSAHLGKHFP